MPSAQPCADRPASKRRPAGIEAAVSPSYTEVRAATYRDKDQSASARFLHGGRKPGRGRGTTCRSGHVAAANLEKRHKECAGPKRPGRERWPGCCLNEMIDITTTRVMATRTHPPVVIFALLLGLGLVGSRAGRLQRVRETRSATGSTPSIMAAILSMTMYVIVDLEYPRLGLIQVNSDQLLVDCGGACRE